MTISSPTSGMDADFLFIPAILQTDMGDFLAEISVDTTLF